MSNDVSKIAVRIAQGDSSISVEDITGMIREVAETIGSVSMNDETEAAAGRLGNSLITAVLTVTNLNEDERFGENLRIQWNVGLNGSRLRTLMKTEEPLPSDLASRTIEVARRKEQQKHLIDEKWAEMLQAVQPIISAATEMKGATTASRRPESGYPAPEPQPYGVSARGAELWVADALRWLGADGVEVTQQSGDGGVDILTSKYAVSVKHYSGAIPVEEVREIFGVSVVMKRTPMLWVSSSLTQAGSAFADAAPVPVFHFDVQQASISALNRHGKELLDEGF